MVLGPLGGVVEAMETVLRVTATYQQVNQPYNVQEDSKCDTPLDKKFNKECALSRSGSGGSGGKSEPGNCPKIPEALNWAPGTTDESRVRLDDKLLYVYCGGHI